MSIYEKKYPLHPLHEAIIENNLKKVEDLIKNGADVNIKDEATGFTALHYASQNGLSETVKILLKSNVDVDAQDKYGNTSLLKAVMFFKGSGEIITHLLQAGANRNLKNNYGRSPLELAKSVTNYRMLHFFEAI